MNILFFWINCSYIFVLILTDKLHRKIAQHSDLTLRVTTCTITNSLQICHFNIPFSICVKKHHLSCTFFLKWGTISIRKISFEHGGYKSSCIAPYDNRLKLMTFFTRPPYFCLKSSIYWVSHVLIFLKAIPTKGSTLDAPTCNLQVCLDRQRHWVFLYSMWDVNNSISHRLQRHLIKACKWQSKEHRIDDPILKDFAYPQKYKIIAGNLLRKGYEKIISY